MQKTTVFGLLVYLVLSAISAQAAPLEWRSFFVAGDHSIENFDNGRKDIALMLEQWGAHAANQTHFTSRDDQLSGDVLPATLNRMSQVFASTHVDTVREGCFFFLTSHGVKNQGFYLSRSGVLTPAQLAKFVSDTCGTAPTVILVSACYSGQFAKYAGLQGPNRVILTAAIADRPSFGCSEDTTYTYWDGCLLESFPQSQTWAQLYSKSRACVERLETQGGFNPSLPQAYFGDNVKSLRILNR